ncbi:hypothetical protein [Sphingobacterium anhuiense]|uniref:hypothetical protein n=1 Tax=Sphingobacterium anhuiense TaxID=493780 RepID=UPI003C2CE63C
MKNLEVKICNLEAEGTAPQLGISKERFEELKSAIIEVVPIKSFSMRFEKMSDIAENANELAFMIYLFEKARQEITDPLSGLVSLMMGGGR